MPDGARTLRCAIAAAALVGCTSEPADVMTASGTWADGQAIRFEAHAHVERQRDGAVVLSAVADGRPRFLGIQLRYDPAAITAPGTYPVDPAPRGRIELYCLRPDETPGAIIPDNVAYEVSRGTIVLGMLPDPTTGGTLSGSFRDVALERMGMPILDLSDGTFIAHLH